MTNRKSVTRYLFNDLILDVQRGMLFRDIEVIPLPKLSYDLLVALVDSSPSLLSQQELMEKVWPDRVIGDETLKQRVKLLRKSLGDDATAPRYIEAVRGRGYRLLPKVKCECVVARPPAVMLDLTVNDLYPNLAVLPLSGLWKKVSKIGLAVFFMLSILFGWQSYLTSSHSIETKSLQQSKAQVIYSDDEILAREFYRKGLSYYKRYRKIDNNIAIDFFLKSIDKDGKYALAYAGVSQAYSQQVFQFEGTDKDKTQAIDYAYLSIAHGGQSAESYKALGTAYYVSGWLSKSVDAYIKALSISPNNIDTVSNLGFIYSEQAKLERALNQIEKALMLSPNHVVSMVHAGQTLQRLGRFRLAKLWYEKAIELQPDYLLATYHLGQLSIEQKQYDSAKKIYTSALSIYKKHPLLMSGLAETYLFSSQIEPAKDLYQKLAKNKSSSDLSTIHILSIVLSGQDKADQVNDLIILLKSVLNSGSEESKHSYNLAILYAHINNEKDALRYLVQAIEQGLTSSYMLIDNPILDPIKGSALFASLLNKIKRKQNQESNSLAEKVVFWSL